MQYQLIIRQSDANGDVSVEEIVFLAENDHRALQVASVELTHLNVVGQLVQGRRLVKNVYSVRFVSHLVSIHEVGNGDAESGFFFATNDAEAQDVLDSFPVRDETTIHLIGPDGVVGRKTA